MSDHFGRPGEAARRALMAAVVLIGGSAWSAADGQAPSSRGLSEVLAANLPAWTGGSGTIEKRRLEALAADPTIRGEEAAALAALLRQFRTATSTSLPTAELDGAADRPGLDRDLPALRAKLGRSTARSSPTASRASPV